MERKTLEDMGLEKEQINQIMAQYGKDVNDLKAQVTSLTGERDTLTAERDNYKTQSADLSKQLKDAQAKIKNSDEQTAQITDLQKQLKDAQKQAQSDILAIKKSNAINNAIKDANAQDTKAVMPYLNVDDISFTDKDGLNGLSEQLETLKTSKPFLFKQEKTNGVQVTIGQTTNDNTPKTYDVANMSYSELKALKDKDPHTYASKIHNQI